MSFSKDQQGEYRQLVNLAWERHCRGNAIPPNDKSAKDHWYRAELLKRIGVNTTIKCNKGRDYDALMAHFEALWGGDIKWQWKLFRGPAKRIMHQLDKDFPGHGIDEEQLRKIARQAQQTENLPELHLLSDKDLQTILRAAKIHAKRQQGEAARVEISEETSQPF